MRWNGLISRPWGLLEVTNAFLSYLRECQWTKSESSSERGVRFSLCSRFAGNSNACCASSLVLRSSVASFASRNYFTGPSVSLARANDLAPLLHLSISFPFPFCLCLQHECPKGRSSQMPAVVEWLAWSRIRCRAIASDSLCYDNLASCLQSYPRSTGLGPGHLGNWRMIALLGGRQGGATYLGLWFVLSDS